MSNIFLAIEITVIGMGLVFAAIILLWWMMNLLTFMTGDQDAPRGTTASDAAPAADSELKAQAAAVAVALALAELQCSSVHPLAIPPTAVVSAWQLSTRTRQLNQKGPIGRQPRKVG